MKKRSFGKEQLPVSEVGLGSWQIGAGWGKVEDSTAREILETAREQGITFFDTADVYGDGRSEKLIGAFFEQKPREVFIATKVGRTPDLYPNGYTKSKVREHITRSLQRLDTDTLDLVQTHCIPRQVMEDGEIYEWLS
ncbi:MAG: aldo/keto reductase, partial [Bacteroidales bacterium]|nr:aldo/keto reductase [Bacteroidales bacterium]